MSIRYSTWYIGKTQLEIQKTALQRELDHVIKSEGMINPDARERLIEELYTVVNQGKEALRAWEEQRVWRASWWDRVKIWLYDWSTKERFAEYRDKSGNHDLE